jgi:serine/threonine protein phosphatase 1
MSKIIAIGDIHGELYKLHNLFDKLSINKSDTLVFLGDYIDRGEHSKDVIDHLLKLSKDYNCVFLKGNHESFFHESYATIFGSSAWSGNSGGATPQIFQSWMINGGKACLRSYDAQALLEGYDNKALHVMNETHGHFFRKLKLTYETDKYIFVHGHLAHEQDLEDQEEWQCLWGRYNDILPHKSGKIVVCGHTPHPHPVDDTFKVCIDTGSFKKNGYISALVIDEHGHRFVEGQ